ncbi:MAG: methyltransferase domain-containing protein [Gammaproteobacteria bacterium]|nr:methyltransferase domain-containing protein [Gammaproteobacteria bacterium]
MSNEPAASTWLRLCEWYVSPFTAAIRQPLTEMVAKILAGLPGQHALAVSAVEFNVAQHYHGHSCLSFAADEAQAFLDQTGIEQMGAIQFPVESLSRDCVILGHALEAAHDPHALLREADRVLCLGGHLLIVGFNPMSIWGMYRPLRRYWAWHRNALWELPFYRVSRVNDWLKLLDFECVQYSSFGYLPLFKNPQWSQRLQVIERVARYVFPRWGNVYCLLARKRRIPITPIKMRWKMREQVLGVGWAAQPNINGNAHTPMDAQRSLIE